MIALKFNIVLMVTQMQTQRTAAHHWLNVKPYTKADANVDVNAKCEQTFR